MSARYTIAVSCVLFALTYALEDAALYRGRGHPQSRDDAGRR